LPGAGLARDARAAALLDFLRRQVVKDRRQPLDVDTALVSSGLVDSLSLIGVLAFVEDNFGVVIPDEAATAASMNTARSILSLVERFERG
jgi:acyl carrier protein